MAQVRIYGLREHLSTCRQVVSDAIHRAAVRALQLPVDKRFHRFILLDREDFIFPADRSDRYTIVEVALMAGRSVETRKALVRAVFDELAGAGISSQDVEVMLFESEAVNWGFRGMHGDEAGLSYSIKI